MNAELMGLTFRIVAKIEVRPLNLVPLYHSLFFCNVRPLHLIHPDFHRSSGLGSRVASLLIGGLLPLVLQQHLCALL